MSLARTALRLAAIEALLADPVIDAEVAGRIYDSEIEAADHREPMPVIRVTTDTTKGKAYSANNGGAPFRTTCSLTVEIMQNVVDGEGEEATLGVVVTNRKLEAQLDLIEERVIAALTYADTPASRLLRDAVTKQMPEYVSDRFPGDQPGVKLAIRYAVFDVLLKDPELPDAAVPVTGPFAALPEPLRTVARALPPGSARDTCAMLAEKSAAGTEVRAPLAGLDLVLAPQALAPDTRPDPAADIAAGRTIGLTLDLPASP